MAEERDTNVPAWPPPQPSAGSPPDRLIRFRRLPHEARDVTPAQLAEAFAYGTGTRDDAVMPAR
jgi:hypothetical protein